MSEIGTQIAVSSFPLGGKPKYSFSMIEIKPLTFIDIISYVDASRKISDNTYGDYERLMMNFEIMKRKVPQYYELHWPDFLYANFLMWSYSVSPDFRFFITYECVDCGEENTVSIDLGSVSFIKYPNVAYQIQLGGKTVNGWFPRAIDVEKKVHEYLSRAGSRILPLDIAILMFSFQDYNDDPVLFENILTNAVHDEARELITILNYITHPIQPVTHTCKNSDCSRQTVIPFYYTIQKDFFRIFNEMGRVAQEYAYSE